VSGYSPLRRKQAGIGLVAACQRATEYGVYNYKVIEQIINNKLDRLDTKKENLIMPLHENIRGAGYYK